MELGEKQYFVVRHRLSFRYATELGEVQFEYGYRNDALTFPSASAAFEALLLFGGPAAITHHTVVRVVTEERIVREEVA